VSTARQATDAPARRLLAALVDDSSLEREPIDDVHADLAALGIDPRRAIALSRRLAAQADAPADRLLHGIAETEAGDDELQQLEQADIADIRRRLPAGTAASAVAEAQRAAGRGSNLVGLRRRQSRRLLYGVGGVAAALAASLVLYVGLSNPLLQFAPGRQAAEMPLAAPSDEAAGNVARYRAESEPSAAERLAAPEPTVAESEAAPDNRQDAPQSVGSADRLQALNQPAASGMQSAGAAPKQGAEASKSMALRDEAISAAELERLAVEQRITALLVVAPDLVPEEVTQRAYPAGHLPDRLEEARRAAPGQPIAALVTLREADRSYDAAIVAPPMPGEQRLLGQDAQPAAPPQPAPGDELYRIIRLPDR
jgi:hypothetical protein